MSEEIKPTERRDTSEQNEFHAPGTTMTMPNGAKYRLEPGKGWVLIEAPPKT